MKLKPLADKVIIERLEAEERTSGGIVLPETAKEKPRQGVVIAVGQGKQKDDGSYREPAVKAGDKVIFQSYAGTEIKDEGKTYLIMSESDILAVVS